MGRAGKLSKDDLVVELVGADYRYRSLCAQVAGLVDDGPLCSFQEEGAVPPKKWAEKIVKQAYAHPVLGDEPDSADVTAYGVESDTADRIFDKAAAKGLVDWPSYEPESRHFSGKAGRYTDEAALSNKEFWSARSPSPEETVRSVSSWDQTAVLSKDALIIDLVRKRWQVRNLRANLRAIAAREDDELYRNVTGERPPKKWLKKIAARLSELYGPDDVSSHLCNYGVGEPTADSYSDRR